MTDDETFEITTLAKVVAQKRRMYEAQAKLLYGHSQTDPLEYEKAVTAYYVIQTQLWEAERAVRKAQDRILKNKRSRKQVSYEGIVITRPRRFFL